MKVLLQVFKIRWSWHFEYWNSAVFSIQQSANESKV